MATNRGKKASVSAEQLAQLEFLKQQLIELQKQMGVAEEEEEYQEKKIAQDDYIRVMSLVPYNLNLATQSGGQGSVKKFTKFGEVKRIIYKDLVDIMEVHRNFLEAGYFYILDPNVIRYHGLNDAYDRILTKEKIEEILDTKSDECAELYNAATEKQQEIIVQLLIDKLKANPDSVNLNVVDRISRLSKVEISKKVDEEKALADIIQGAKE
jgi:hypothetical protein